MKMQKRILIGVAGLALAAIAAYAGTVATKTFRTCGYFVGVTQGTNPVTGDPNYDYFNFAGHNLVDLAMGRGIHDTNFPRQVMAMTFACDLSSANLVVYDESTSNVVATIASSTCVDRVYHQDTNQKGPNRAHFVAMLQFVANGNGTNGVQGGYATVAGRVNLNPKTGCPQPVFIWLDRDSLDRVDDDVELAANADPDSVPPIQRTGIAHLIGVVDLINQGAANTVLVPYGGLSIRRQLPIAP